MTIAIASGKGGTGKTTLAVNLSALLAMTHPVLLVDLDVEAPNSALFLQGEPVHQQELLRMVPQWDAARCQQCDICSEVCAFNAVVRIGSTIEIFPQLCHGCGACSQLCPYAALPMTGHRTGMLQHLVMHGRTAALTAPFQFIESRLDVGEEQAVPAISQAVEYAQQAAGPEVLRIFDSPPGTSCPVIEAVKTADTVLLVTEPTPFGMHDLRLAVETMRTLDKHIAVIVNRWGIGDDDVLSYCLQEGIDIIARLPDRRAVAKGYAQGELVYNADPEFALEFQKIVSYVERIWTAT